MSDIPDILTSDQLKDHGSLPGAHTNPPALVIGIDFGTTYSGISWALTAAPDEIYLVKSWPSKGNTTFEKVPSEISYNGTSRLDGNLVNFEWGFKSQKDNNRMQWIKLLLDPTQNSKIDGLNFFTDRAQEKIPKNMTACDIVTDFLSGLRAHVHQEIRDKFGDDFLDITPKQYVFTVPAIWSDKAKALTQKAVKAAGFTSDNDDLLLVPEPEAAALCCLKTIQPNNIKVGDNFVVVDCGGGTVDLISYEILRLKPSMEVRESAVGDGDLCGSVIVNTLFEKLLRERIGRDKFTALSSACRQLVLSRFDEDVKRAFSDDEDEEIFTVPLPGVEDDSEAGVEGGFFVITRDDMRDIFRPVMERIQKLVEGQCNAIKGSGGNVSGLLLVGGFGSSQYLLKHFRAWGKENGNIQVLQPPDAWSCIVRGAVMAGLQREKEVVKSRLSRRYYGVSFQEPFLEGYHPEKYKWFSPYQNRNFCGSRMRWFIQKGDKIQENDPFDHAFYREYFEDSFNKPWERRCHDILYAYDGDSPPRFSDCPGVYKVTDMDVDLSKIPESAWVRKNYGGEDVMELDYDLRMVLHGAMLSFELRCQGKQHGYVTTKFE